MIIANSKFATIPSRFDPFKTSFFVNNVRCYCVIYGNNVKCLTSKNKFKEDLRL